MPDFTGRTRPALRRGARVGGRHRSGDELVPRRGATGPFFDLFILIANPNPTPAQISGAIGIYANTTRPHAAALFIDYMLSAEGAKGLASTGRLSGRKGVRALYEELDNLEERGIPLLVIGPDQTEQVSKPMEKIMKEVLVP